MAPKRNNQSKKWNEDDSDTLDWSCGNYVLFPHNKATAIGQFKPQVSEEDKLKVTLYSVKNGEARRGKSVVYISRDIISHGPFKLVSGSKVPDEALLKLGQPAKATKEQTASPVETLATKKRAASPANSAAKRSCNQDLAPTSNAILADEPMEEQEASKGATEHNGAEVGHGMEAVTPASDGGAAELCRLPRDVSTGTTENNSGSNNHPEKACATRTDKDVMATEGEANSAGDIEETGDTWKGEDCAGNTEKGEDCAGNTEKGEDCAGNTEKEEDCGGDTEKEEDCGGDTEKEEDCAGDTEKEDDCGGDTEKEEDCTDETEKGEPVDTRM